MKCLTWASLSPPTPLEAHLMTSLAPSVAKGKEIHAIAGLGHGPPSHTYRQTSHTSAYPHRLSQAGGTLSVIDLNFYLICEICPCR